MPAERCADVGVEAEPACVAVCCDWNDGGRRAGVMSNAECQARDEMTNPDLCEAEVCRGLGDGAFRQLMAQECTALGHVIVQDRVCEEDVRNDDRVPLIDGGQMRVFARHLRMLMAGPRDVRHPARLPTVRDPSHFSSSSVSGHSSVGVHKASERVLTMHSLR